jgi:molybdopterin-binding protein
MKLSARNKLKGKILEVKKGATTAHVRLEIAPGQIVRLQSPMKPSKSSDLDPAVQRSQLSKPPTS